MNSRCCSRTACKQPPVYTLTYVYKDSTAVLGPLAGYVDPHSWDLCEMHAAPVAVTPPDTRGLSSPVLSAVHSYREYPRMPPSRYRRGRQNDTIANHAGVMAQPPSDRYRQPL